ncbi:hypothetical protein ACN6K4_001599 [Streptomyces hayashii]|uniref:hypothetical protein n=1 Tax=Streptomyces hayashii TaxID=2839966 RepID=UPI00403D1668
MPRSTPARATDLPRPGAASRSSASPAREAAPTTAGPQSRTPYAVRRVRRAARRTSHPRFAEPHAVLPHRLGAEPAAGSREPGAGSRRCGLSRRLPVTRAHSRAGVDPGRSARRETLVQS